MKNTKAIFSIFLFFWRQKRGLLLQTSNCWRSANSTKQRERKSLPCTAWSAAQSDRNAETIQQVKKLMRLSVRSKAIQEAEVLAKERTQRTIFILVTWNMRRIGKPAARLWASAWPYKGNNFTISKPMAFSLHFSNLSKERWFFKSDFHIKCRVSAVEQRKKEKDSWIQREKAKAPTLEKLAIRATSKYRCVHNSSLEGVSYG